MRGERRRASQVRFDDVETVLESPSTFVKDPTNTALGDVQGQLGSLDALEQQVKEQAALVASQQQAVQALQSKGNGDVEQSLLIMRTELDQRAAQTEQALDAIDSFRLQTNRSINTLQSQLQALHAQVQGN